MWKISKLLFAPFLLIGIWLIYQGFTASFDPLIADYSFQNLYYLMGAGFIILPLLIMAGYKIVNDRETNLIQNGIRGQAKILDMNQTGTYINNLPQVKFLLQITTPYMEPYQIEHTKVVNMISLGSIRIGAVLPVYVDPNNSKRVSLSFR